MSQSAGTVTKEISAKEKAYVDGLVFRAREALAQSERHHQARADRLCQAVAWAVANEETSVRLARMSVEESGLGDPVGRASTRLRIMGILRDILRQKSIGVIEEVPTRGIVKYAKPVGVIGSLVPVTDPQLTPASVALFSIKCRDAVIFSPHPRSSKTTFEIVKLMRKALEQEGACPDILQCIENPTIPISQYLMSVCDMVQATGGSNMVRAAYSSGTPAYGVGAGNATVVIDETADVEQAARNTRISKTADFGSGCSCDGNAIVETSIYDRFVAQLVEEGGYLARGEEIVKLQDALWDEEGHRKTGTVAVALQRLAEIAGFKIPNDRRFIIVERDKIGPKHPFSREKLSLVLATYRYEGFDSALDMVRRILEVGGKGHSCGIYSHDEDHIRQLASMAPVSRIMVRQPQTTGNAGWFNNGMPMTGSLGCGTWGGNITSQNISLPCYINTTWVSYPIPEDRPSERELFGEFYGTAVS